MHEPRSKFRRGNRENQRNEFPTEWVSLSFSYPTKEFSPLLKIFPSFSSLTGKREPQRRLSLLLFVHFVIQIHNAKEEHMHRPNDSLEHVLPLSLPLFWPPHSALESQQFRLNPRHRTHLTISWFTGLFARCFTRRVIVLVAPWSVTVGIRLNISPVSIA